MALTVFTVPGCPRCEQVKEYLRARGAAFTELNVEGSFAHLKRLRRLTPAREVPVTAGGGGVVVGFDPDALQALLAGELPGD